ncbi:MAG: hypothetical protein LBM61_02385, partial [Prevotellaceae bacterium]|nr:hypothetical protein [Prevotellaceae bacterium]
MVDISNYGILYPELVYDIWYFFSDLNTPGWLSADLKKRGININVKCSIDFSKKFSNKYKHTDKISPLQLWVISAICDRLCEKGFLRPIEPAGFNRSEGMEFYYNYASKDDLQKDKR